MDRKVDSMIIVLIDALRFEFAYYNLPNYVGKHLPPRKVDTKVDTPASLQQHERRTHSRLFQFVPDPSRSRCSDSSP
jgi:hypothetical protein